MQITWLLKNSSKAPIISTMYVFYHLFSKAILVSAINPTIVTMDITHFSNMVPRNCSIIPKNDNGNVTIRKTDITIPQNLLNLIGII
jgi:hypothetical protein